MTSLIERVAALMNVSCEQVQRMVEGWSDRMAIDYLVELEVTLKQNEYKP
jgi:hypothetical protein